MKAAEIYRTATHVYGVAFWVCRNAEVLGQAHDAANFDDADAVTFCDDAGRVLTAAGFDYDTESSFRAYNGGMRTATIDAVWWKSEIYHDHEGDEFPPEWEYIHDAAKLPREAVEKADELVGRAARAGLSRIMATGWEIVEA